MRTLPILMFMSMFALPAHAQTAADPPAAQHARMSWEQHFAQANASHDGHLTLAQAKSGYVTIARHFQDIDATGKGYVTEDDIRAWHKQQRTTRHAKTASDDDLRPRPAMQHVLPGQRTFNSPTQHVTPTQEDASRGQAATADNPATSDETH